MGFIGNRRRRGHNHFSRSSYQSNTINDKDYWHIFAVKFAENFGEYSGKHLAKSLFKLSRWKILLIIWLLTDKIPNLIEWVQWVLSSFFYYRKLKVIKC